MMLPCPKRSLEIRMRVVSNETMVVDLLSILLVRSEMMFLRYSKYQNW